MFYLFNRSVEIKINFLGCTLLLSSISVESCSLCGALFVCGFSFVLPALLRSIGVPGEQRVCVCLCAVCCLCCVRMLETERDFIMHCVLAEPELKLIWTLLAGWCVCAWAYVCECVCDAITISSHFHAGKTMLVLVLLPPPPPLSPLMLLYATNADCVPKIKMPSRTNCSWINFTKYLPFLSHTRIMRIFLYLSVAIISCLTVDAHIVNYKLAH